MSLRSIDAFVVGFIVGIILVGIYVQVNTPSYRTTDSVSPPSRAWMLFAQDIVRADKPTPPVSARLYAYVATAYSKTIDATTDHVQASAVTYDVLSALSAEHSSKISTFFSSTTGVVRDTVTLTSESEVVKKTLFDRMKVDGLTNEWDGTIPQGEQYWVGKDPFSPRAGTWERWVITEEDDISAPPPPPRGSPEHTEALKEVAQSAKMRTVEQGAAVNFWGGVPGSEAPAGIWQNRLYDETHEYDLGDNEYAYVQMILAQALADSFIECWEEKYTYWTKRPSMDDPSIIEHMAMDNPNFPSYISGHSTISSTAAVVLSAFFPEKRSTWIRDAEEARDSRLWGGIHFSYDNERGFELGEKIGKSIVRRLELKEVQ